MITVTAFPMPGENFVDRTGTTRGVTGVRILNPNKDIRVEYLEGEPEVYASGKVNK